MSVSSTLKALSWVGKYSLTLCHSMKCGTPNQDIEMFNFPNKLVPYGYSYDGNNGPKQTGDSARKKRKLVDYFKEMSEKRSAVLKELTSTIKQPLLSFSAWKFFEFLDTRYQKIQRMRALAVQRAQLSGLNVQDDITKASLAILNTEMKSIKSS